MLMIALQCNIKRRGRPRSRAPALAPPSRRREGGSGCPLEAPPEPGAGRPAWEGLSGSPGPSGLAGVDAPVSEPSPAPAASNKDLREEKAVKNISLHVSFVSLETRGPVALRFPA